MIVLSYDYEELLAEIRDEIDGGLLSEDEEIQILRGRPLSDGYQPIIDWYYSHDEMVALREDEWAEGTLTDSDWMRYLIDRPRLKKARIGDVVEEMENRNKIIPMPSESDFTGRKSILGVNVYAEDKNRL